MPNLTHFESRGSFCLDMPSLKSVNFENLEFINTELHAKGDSRTIDFCSIPNPYKGKPFQLTDVNFTQLKMAYCNLLQNCGATRLGLPNLEIVMKFTDFPYLEDISLPKLTECQYELLCKSPKLKVVKLPMLEKCGGRLLDDDTSLEEIDLPKLTVIPAYFLDATYADTTGSGSSPSPNLKSINMPSATTTNGSFLIKQISPNLTAVSLPKLQSTAGDSFIEDTALQKIELPEFTTAGGKFVCNCNSLIEVSFPKLQTIGGDAITNDSTLQTVEMPELQSVSGKFVYDCNALTKVSFPKLQSIGGHAISHDSTLQTVEMPELQSAGGDLVYLCHKLTFADFGALTKVGQDFIGNSPSIKTIIIRSAVVPTINGKICDSKPSDCILYVPDDMISKYLADSKWSAAFNKDHIKPISEAPQPPA